jgi:hypothetical protein
MNKNNLFTAVKINPFIWYILLFLPIILYAVTIGILHKNLPAFDDYIVQLEIAHVIEAESFLEKIKIIFAQLNEHRIAYTRLWFLIDYITTEKSLSYSALIFIGNLPLLGIWILFLWWMKRIECSPWAMLCVGWILFQFQFYENSLWAMASLQNITIHFLYLLLFTLLSIPGRKYWVWSFLVAVVTCYTSGNGFFVLGIGMLSLIFQKRWSHLIWWVGFTALLSALYFYGYESNRNYSTFEGAPAPVIDKLFGFAAFLGQICVIHPKVANHHFIIRCGFILSFLAIVLCVVGVIKLWKIYIRNQEIKKDHYFLVVLIQVTGFILFSAAILSHTRIEAGDYQAAIISRYQLYPTMLIICIFCMTLILANRLKMVIAGAALPVAILVWLSIFQTSLPGMYQFRSDILVSFYNTTDLPNPDSLLIEKVFTPKLKSEAELTLIQNALKTPEPWKGTALKISSASVDCEECVNSSLPDETSYIVLYHPLRQIIYPVRRTPNAGFLSFWLKGKLFMNGFQGTINPFFYLAAKNKLTYRVGILQRDKTKMKFYLTQSALDFI